ncbi:MAG: 3-phosphoglycerate dehydrogenase [Clostridiales Family XIII bacterium]|jgi:D-3-phosphoglycerate dehydrogenase|nr:3-phosphoglycerate dehydrogenase [Clostridiales Family XIII bacterium]
MYNIATLNNISHKGMSLLTDDYQVVEDLAEASAVIVRSADMHELELPGGLLAIARAGAGYNNIPVDKCAEKGIVVFNTPGANANAVKELVLAAMLIASRNILDAVDWAKTLKEGVAAAVEKGKSQFAGAEIYGKTLGVVGLGYIGVLVANAAEALGMKVVGYDPYLSVKAAHDLSSSVELYGKLEAMLPECDYVTIHVPANAETKGMFGAPLLRAMKNKGVLLNFSRDSLVVSKDVKKALKDQKLRFYITDFPTDDMVGVEGTILIPHLGASTRESEENCAVMAVKEVMNFFEQGVIENAVNFPAVNPEKKPDDSPRIIVMHKNVPKVLTRLSGSVSEMGINISNMINKSKGDFSVTILDPDAPVDEQKLRAAYDFEGVISVRIIP